MSLINEALRKAQNQRTSAPGLGNGFNSGNPSVNYAGRSTPYSLIIGLGLCILILVGLVAGLTTVLLSKNTTSPVQPPATPVESATPLPGTALEPSIPESATDTAEPEPTLAESAEPESQGLTPEPAGQAPAAVETPAIISTPNQEIVDWLAQSIVSGLRITSSSSKVILNNKGYMPGEIVNMELGLKVLTIEENRIVFVDANGIEYVKLL